MYVCIWHKKNLTVCFSSCVIILFMYLFTLAGGGHSMWNHHCLSCTQCWQLCLIILHENYTCQSVDDCCIMMCDDATAESPSHTLRVHLGPLQIVGAILSLVAKDTAAAAAVPPEPYLMLSCLTFSHITYCDHILKTDMVTAESRLLHKLATWERANVTTLLQLLCDPWV